MIKSIFSYLFFFVYYFIFSVILVKKMIKKKKIIEPIFIAKLTIRNYPSKTEILEIIDIYISSNDLKKDYEVEEKTNSMILTFKDTTIANLILKYLKLKILENQKTYEKMTVNLKSEILNAPEYKHKEVKSSYDFIPKKSINPNKKGIISKSRKKGNKSNIEESPYLLGEPYTEQSKLKQKEEMKKKKLWISKKGFNNFASNNNSVLKETPVYSGPGVNSGNYKFREIHKELWSNGNFLV